jgi:hypothetical protein
MKRKRRPGEVTCRCGVYRFPHRMMGGACNGGGFVERMFESMAGCKGCWNLEQSDEEGYRCKVLHGGESVMTCEPLIELIQFEGIKLYGVNKPPPKKRGCFSP